MKDIMFQDSKRDTTKFDKKVEELFHWGMYIKGVDAILEIIGAFLVFIPSPSQLNQFIIFATQHELSEDPTDFVGNYLRGITHAINSQVQLYGFLYLMIHGVIKLFLIVMLLKNKLWAYPVSIVAFILFILYQMYHYVLHPSFGLIILTIFDIAIIILTWAEYRILKKNHAYARST